ncbi:30S ribosomal protein S1 [Acidaminobacter hydrogenoformans]|uniref:Small subunit ribosomal protein S1 n=1 Tax=Acidaminobacter hydrogenoformans DSM 2784 TaxID=1120920 RepID=A0A1G5S4U2_9FIRM|nr:30S ribosomal protein S1 [Acidaminobacter hydrogenoformans]SCZ80771.1 small subunit ribosomal protein S1 [Acidaminobacter hydrogenoformans DSM 2784]
MTDNEMTMEELMGDIDKSMTRLNQGDCVEGTVISNNGEELVVNLEHMTDGVMPKNEMDFEDGSSIESVEVGAKLRFVVVKEDDGQGNVVLSRKRALALDVWDEINESLESGTPLSVKVSEVVKGGVVGKYKGIRFFMPASQVRLERVEDLNEVIGESMDVVAIEVRNKKDFVVSGRKYLEAQRALKEEEIYKTLQAGETVEGVVRRLADFGAFVDIGGVDGLVHLSELSWKRVKSASEVVSVGDRVKVTVLNVDPEKRRISLRLADYANNPWNTVNEMYRVDQVVTGVIRRLQPFGAFVELSEGLEGLVHVSQISDARVEKPSDVLSVGQEVKVRILGIDADQQRISLSIKAAQDNEAEAYEAYAQQEEEANDASATLGDLFGDKLKDFLK